MRKAIRLIFPFVLSLLSACAALKTAKPYGEFGVGATVDKFSDWYLRNERAAEIGHDPTFEGALGIEWPKHKRCELYHWSHLLDGGPLNSNPELYELRFRCMKGYGGY